MASFRKAPSAWMGAGYSVASNKARFTTNDGTPPLLTKLTDSTGAPTTGDIRSVFRSLCYMMSAAWDAQTGRQPRKMTVAKETEIWQNNQQVLVESYEFRFDTTLDALAVLPEEGPQGIPAAPVGLIARPGNDTVQLDWQNAQYVTWNVWRGTGANFQDATALATGLTSPTYTDNTASSGTSFFYWIVAVNTIGASLPSNPVLATPLSPPGDPQSFAVSGLINPADFTTAWTAPITGGPAQLYRLQWQLAGAGWGTYSETTTTGLTASATGLDPDTLYDVRVRAENVGGESGWAELTNINTALAPPLDDYETGLQVAWSVARRLLTSYTGPIIKVRRSSDDTLLDIERDDTGAMDEAALLAFAGGNDAYLHTIYDQSGRSLDFIQATTTEQLQIVAAGVLHTIGSGTPRPSGIAVGASTGGYASTSTFTTYTGTQLTAVLVCSIADSGSSAQVLNFAKGTDSSNTTGGARIARNGTSSDLLAVRALSTTIATLAVTYDTPLATGLRYTGTDGILIQGISSQTGATTLAFDINRVIIGGTSTATQGMAIGDQHAEGAVWLSDIGATDLATIMAEQDAYFGL